MKPIVSPIARAKGVALVERQNNRRTEKMNPTNREIEAKLTRSLLELIILQLLENKPMYGFEMMKKIRKSFGISLRPSAIYPLLSAFEKKNYIKSEWLIKMKRPRKMFTLTENGKAMLAYSAGALKRICNNLSSENKTGNVLQYQIQTIPSKQLRL